MRTGSFCGGVIIGMLACSIAFAQSPGSIESEMNSARSYLEVGSWDYAMWAYERVLLREPDHAEAKEGYARAKAANESKEAAKKAAARQMSSPARAPATRAGRAAPAAKATPASGSAKVSSAQAECDRLFGACWVTSRSPNCFVQKRMCYNRNGIK